jgi:endonuclease YncB( thermonuclease family)
MTPYTSRNRVLKVFLIMLPPYHFFPALCLAGQFKITRVIDGDSVIAFADDVRIEVRLVGIDAPEGSRAKGQPGQPYRQQSKK